MCCITLTALETMATTNEFTHRLCTQASDSWMPRSTKPVHMNWVVVTRENGQRQLRMHWDVVSKDD